MTTAGWRPGDGGRKTSTATRSRPEARRSFTKKNSSVWMGASSSEATSTPKLKDAGFSEEGVGGTGATPVGGSVSGAGAAIVGSKSGAAAGYAAFFWQRVAAETARAKGEREKRDSQGERPP